MTEDRVTTVETPHGTSHTTVVSERSGGGGAGWLVAIVLVLALVAGIYFFSQTSGSEAARDNAIADAASEVGQAAGQVGDAAQDAANRVNNR